MEIEDLDIWKKTAEIYNKPTENIKIKRPKPCPPISTRPKELSATRIETLLTNPYEIYAQKVLKLYKKNEIGEENTFAVFGNAVHKTLEDFVLDYEKIQGDKLEYFMKIGNKIFDEHFVDEISKELWRPRLKNIAKWFVNNERKIRESGIKIFAEQEGKIKVAECEFWVTAKADRMQIDEQGNVDIIDYKTGTAPSAKNVKIGISPQLSIEAYILKNGGFIDIKTRITNINGLEYWEIKGKEKKPKITPVSKPKKATEYFTDDLIQSAKDGLIKLAIYFENPENPYIASAKVNDKFDKKGKDYLHLSRSEEWNG